MKAFLKSEKMKKAAPFLVLFLTVLILHIILWEHPDLDTLRYFARALKKRSFFEFLTMRYDSWSSRIIIEGTLVLLAKRLALWKLLDTLVFLLLGLSLAKILTGSFSDVRMNWYVAGAVLLYPFGEMQSAGWIATTLNYFWPLAFGIFSCTLLADLCRGKKIHPVRGIMCVLAALFACNMEQACGVLFVLYAFFLVWFLLTKKQFFGWNLALLAAAAANLCLILFCPGNRVRMVEELETSTLDFFPTASPGEKLLYAFNDTCGKALDENYVFLIVCTALFIAVLLKTKSLAKRLISLIPLLLLLYRYVISDFLPSLSLLLLERPALSRETANTQPPWMMFFFFLLLLAAVALSLVWLAADQMERILFPLLLLLGIGSRVIVGLSPTLENSSYRTFLYFDFILLFLMLASVRNAGEQKGKRGEAIRLAYGGAVVLSVLNTFAYAARILPP